MSDAPSISWHRTLREFAGNLGLSFIVSLLVSGVIGFYFESKLENSKQVVAVLDESKQKFDDSHNALIAQIGIFANDVWAKKKPSNKSKILETIFTAQAQLIELNRQMGDMTDPKIVAYQSELNRLQNELDAVSGPNDLRPLYASVIQLLAKHDAIASEVAGKAKVPSV